jgi:hypothetical protein
LSVQQTVFPRGTDSGAPVSSKEAHGSRFDLRQIGEVLRETRIGKGCSLSDVSESLFLTKSTLEAIESGHWDVLPHPVYVKGYVKSYASYLKISEKIEEHLNTPLTSLPDPLIDEMRDGPSKDGAAREPQGVPPKSLGLLCSAFVGLVSVITGSPALQTESAKGLQAVFVPLQIAALSLRRFSLL